MSAFSQKMAATAARLIDKFGADYAINGGATSKGIEIMNVDELRSNGVVAEGQRAYFFYSPIVTGDLINVDSEDLYVSSAENKRLDNDLIVTRVVVDK